MDEARAVLERPSLQSFERLVRALLAAAAEFGGFDVAYLTSIDWSRREQLVRYACNVGSVEVAEGHLIAVPPDLDEHLFLGVTRSNGTPAPQPDSHVARGLGMATYVSVPVVSLSHTLYGTLCGASRAANEVDDATVSAMQCFAGLLSDHMARDETDAMRVRTTAAEHQLEERTRLLAESEHMLKTHVAVITGWATRLSEDGHRLSRGEQDRAIEMIRGQADKLGVELQHMLEQAKSEIEVIDLAPVDVDVAAIVRESTANLDESSPHHTVVHSAAEPVHAMADAAMLHQVLAHLVDNAVKYSPPDSTVDVSVGKSGRWAVIEVKDQGMGIPKDVDVFIAFKRGEGDAVQATDGVGLGLHIVRTLVQSMGGLVTARRNVTAGSTFTVLLPLTARPPGGRGRLATEVFRI